MYGRSLPTLISYYSGASRVDAVDMDLGKQDKLIRDLRMHLSQAQNKMKQLADKHRREWRFVVGQLVYIKFQTCKQITISKHRSHKLFKKFHGPYKVFWKIG